MSESTPAHLSRERFAPEPNAEVIQVWRGWSYLERRFRSVRLRLRGGMIYPNAAERFSIGVASRMRMNHETESFQDPGDPHHTGSTQSYAGSHAGSPVVLNRDLRQGSRRAGVDPTSDDRGRLLPGTAHVEDRFHECKHSVGVRIMRIAGQASRSLLVSCLSRNVTVPSLC